MINHSPVIKIFEKALTENHFCEMWADFEQTDGLDEFKSNLLKVQANIYAW